VHFLKHGMTALMVACQEGHLDIAKHLVTQRAEVDAKDNVSYRDKV
jgi:hypothetical protein